MNIMLSQPVAQGDNTENAWREFFKCFLPSRYCCDKIFAIDSKENFSEQIDIAIYDTYFSPLLFKSGGNTYIPAESIYAVFEVKPVLNKTNFEYAQNKIASVRKLYRTNAPVICNGKKKPGRKPFHIIGGLLTTRNNWKTKLCSLNVVTTDNGRIDIGCCIEDKTFLLKGNKYEWCNRDSLLTFFMQLLYMLQKQGSVPAMEIDKYYKVV